MQHRGIGTLFYEDGREWGPVRYVVDVQPPTQTRIGRIAGHLWPLEPGDDPMPFFSLVEQNEALALRMDEDDGQWWLCHLKNTGGDAMNSGGKHQAGPMPKRMP